MTFLKFPLIFFPKHFTNLHGFRQARIPIFLVSLIQYLKHFRIVLGDEPFRLFNFRHQQQVYDDALKLVSSSKFSLSFCALLLYEHAKLSYVLFLSQIRLQSSFQLVFSFSTPPLLNQLQCQILNLTPNQQYLLLTHIFQKSLWIFQFFVDLYSIITFQRHMEITKPKVRNQRNTQADRVKAVKLFDKKPLNFKQYCELSFICIEEEDEFFLRQQNRQKYNSILKAEKVEIKPVNADQSQQMNTIIKILSYYWKNILGLIENKKQNKDDNLGIYSSENINMHFARLEEMLIELRSRNYRCDVYMKQHAYSREIAEKEMTQELVFIKLLKNILTTQTKKIEEERKRHVGGVSSQPNISEEQREEYDRVVQKLPSLSQIIDVKKYFNKKYAEKEQTKIIKDAIDLQHQKRRFNSAVIRYHLQNSQRK